MKTAIVYYSRHHGNTKKLIDALAAEQDITAIDAAETAAADLTGYDLVGFASGIYYSKFHKTVQDFAQANLPEGKPVFFLFTCGAKKDSYTKSITQAVSERHARVLGQFGCLGYDTYGPFKLIGGVAKGHPDETDLEGVRRFFAGLVSQV